MPDESKTGWLNYITKSETKYDKNESKDLFIDVENFIHLMLTSLDSSLINTSLTRLILLYRFLLSKET